MDKLALIIDGKTILVIAVPRARRQDRPVFINDDLFGGTFVRVHDGDRRPDRERIRRMVAEAEFDSRDERVLPKSGFADLAPETLRDYRDGFRAWHRDHPWAEVPDEQFLQHLGPSGSIAIAARRG